ncbi:MAG: hypothetical protein ACHQ1H_06015 [Nitrososphaerales archaeon]
MGLSHGTLIVIGLFAMAITISPLWGGAFFGNVSQAANPPAITKTSSGLIAADPLNQNLNKSQLENSGYWRFTGDAQEENASYDFYENSGGLYIGVQANSNSTYAGFFAVSPNTQFLLAHVQITAPAKTVPYSAYEAGLYVQTASGNVNYVTCTTFTTNQGTVWEIVWATGNTSGATHYITLWTSGTNLPLTEDCTIITNGQNYLKVFLGGSQVYYSTSLNLLMPTPFQVYLEPETTYTGSLLYSVYRNYYVTVNQYLTVNGLPSNAARVVVVNTAGKIIASARASKGIAAVGLGNFVFPIVGTIRILDASNIILASTPGTVSIYGGDSYASPITITVKTVSVSGATITGLYTYITNSSGQTVAQGYSPLRYSNAVNGMAYTSCAGNYGKYTFSHWSNGNTNPCLRQTPKQSITLVAYYNT